MNGDLPVAADSRRRLKLALVGCAGAAALTALLVVWLGRLDAEGANGVFRFQQRTWERFPGLAGLPQNVKVSDGGLVWVSTVYRDGLSRLEGRRWRYYSEAEVGVEEYTRAGFALDSDAVWAAGRDSAARFDGRRWIGFRVGTVIDRFASVAACGGQAWVIDRGNLSIFDGKLWRATSIGLPDAKWDRTRAYSSRLGCAPDGSLWLVGPGVWRLDGTTWRRVRGDGDVPKSPFLLGVAGGRLWLRDGAGVCTVSMDGSPWGRYTTADMGLSDNARATSVAQDGDAIWLATTAGLAAFDGGKWRHMPEPEAGATQIVSIAAGPRGTVWVVAIRKGLGWSHFVGPTMGLVVWAAAMWMMIAALRRAAGERQETADG